MNDQAKFVCRVYLWTALGVGVTAAFAALGAFTPFALVMQNEWAALILLLLSLALIMVMSNWKSGPAKVAPSAPVSVASFVGLATLNGLCFSSVAHQAATRPGLAGSMVVAFGVATFMFLVMSVVGAVAKHDHQRHHGIAIGGLLALIVAVIANAYLDSDIFGYLISIAGLVLFGWLVVRDSQAAWKSKDHSQGASIWWSLGLYLDFLNIFSLLIGRQRK